MTAVPRSTGGLLDLSDPEVFAANAMWDGFTRLRAEAPIVRQAAPDGDHWALTRHRDLVTVYGDTESFASRYGMRLGSHPGAVAAVAQHMLIVSDGPEHRQLKRILMGWFGPDQWPRMQQLVDLVVTDVLAGATDCDLDFIGIAKALPNHVVCALMDLPRSDWEWIGSVTTGAFVLDDEASASAHGEIFLYFMDLLAERRRRPGDDFISWVATRAYNGSGDRPLSDEEIVANCNGVLAGANETTRYAAAGAVVAFAENPAQWARLRAAGPTGVPGAVEEILRWTSPGVHALRTVVRPVRLGDVDLLPGERVSLWNISANRDERVFHRSDRFLIDRHPNRHLGFGHGRHLCLGARLARYELQALLMEFLDRVEEFTLFDDPAYTRSNFTWGVERCPAHLRGRRS